MKKVLFAALAVLFLISCKGTLWDGDDSSVLTISINNPFYFGGSASSSSRALALQGKYLYIELARIDNQALYNADTGKALTGNGTWDGTAWGGHAIVTVDLTDWTTALDAIFKDVPRDSDIQARVILESSATVFSNKLVAFFLRDLVNMPNLRKIFHKYFLQEYSCYTTSSSSCQIL
jgi:hypothetical protein